MNRSIVLGGVAAAFAFGLALAPTAASASCAERKTTGTIVGGVGGALIGNSISGGGGGAILGGLGGAVVGHEIAGAGCSRYRHAYYDRGRSYGSRGYASRDTGYRSNGYQPRTRTVYYDQRGNPLPDAAPAYGQAPYTQAAYGPPACGSRSYYDSRGNLVQQPVSNCR